MLFVVWIVTPLTNIYLFIVNNRNTIKSSEICSKLTVRTSERRHEVFLGLESGKSKKMGSSNIPSEYQNGPKLCKTLCTKFSPLFPYFVAFYSKCWKILESAANKEVLVRNGLWYSPAGNYMIKVSNRNTRTRGEIFWGH